MMEYCYRLNQILDLSLNKYASLEGTGVEGILERHITFLRQWNRKGIISNTSFHLMYIYDGNHVDNNFNTSKTKNGSKLDILFIARGEKKS